MPKSVLNTLIKLRHMSGEEIREYFQKRADFHSKYPNNLELKASLKKYMYSKSSIILFIFLLLLITYDSTMAPLGAIVIIVALLGFYTW